MRIAIETEHQDLDSCALLGIWSDGLLTVETPGGVGYFNGRWNASYNPVE